MPFHRYLIFVGINVIYKKLPRVSRELSARCGGSKMQLVAFFLSCLGIARCNTAPLVLSDRLSVVFIKNFFEKFFIYD